MHIATPALKLPGRKIIKKKKKDILKIIFQWQSITCKQCHDTRVQIFKKRKRKKKLTDLEQFKYKPKDGKSTIFQFFNISLIG